ncbi:formin-1-like [Macrobrachium rosenbergii]|uniref:formin-1-like n=1 Tax=Macrobrachium rosenbergii TaxID=79674 RepID=UPI0034D397B3
MSTEPRGPALSSRQESLSQITPWTPRGLATPGSPSALADTHSLPVPLVSTGQCQAPPVSAGSSLPNVPPVPGPELVPMPDPEPNPDPPTGDPPNLTTMIIAQCEPPTPDELSGQDADADSLPMMVIAAGKVGGQSVAPEATPDHAPDSTPGHSSELRAEASRIPSWTHVQCFLPSTLVKANFGNRPSLSCLAPTPGDQLDRCKIEIVDKEELEKLKEQNLQRYREVLQLENECTQKQKEVIHLLKESKTVVAEKSKANGKLNEMTRRRVQLEFELAEAKEELETMEFEKMEATLELERLQEETLAKDTKIRSLETKVKILKGEKASEEMKGHNLIRKEKEVSRREKNMIKMVPQEQPISERKAEKKKGFG